MQLLLFTERERLFLDQDPEHEHVDDGFFMSAGQKRISF